MNWDKLICSITVMALLLTAVICAKAYGENHVPDGKRIVANSRALVFLGPQPEPPDRKITQQHKIKGHVKPHEAKCINPQPEPPGRSGR